MCAYQVKMNDSANVKYKSYCFAAVIFAASLTLITSCSSPEKIGNSEWCGAVRSKLSNNSITWPIGNGGLDSSKLTYIDETFKEYKDRAQGDLEVAALAWHQGFSVARPFLETNDLEGFNKEVDQSRKDQLRLAGLAINNLCQWDQW